VSTSDQAEAEVVVQAGDLQPYVASIFAGAGMSDDDAATMGTILVEADLRGVHTHGVAFVPLYVERLLDPDGIDPRGRPEVVRSDGATAVVDARNAMGHIAALFAMGLAIETAGDTNIAAVAVRGSNHCGAMAYYPMLALEHDMIGLATSNALPSMAPWGAIDQIIGNNPLSAAIPAGDEEPIVIDQAFQNTFPLKVELWRQRGWPIPDDWSLDANGKPTTDYDAALQGWGRPSGNYKGVAMALLTGTLAALLSGAAWGRELGAQLPEPRPYPGHDGHFFAAIRIAAFEDPGRFRARVDKIVREFHGARTVEGVDRARLPGERAAETAAKRRVGGIPLPMETLNGLARTAEKVEVPARTLP
jgi:LDH2 family malate/lactate/ureidoglycolate dehydrogenase